jgi:hypothetical protein
MPYSSQTPPKDFAAIVPSYNREGQGEINVMLNTAHNEVEVILDSLQPFDTIFLRTQNSDYRILLLDPKTGRALVEGGSLVGEPKEAFLCGSRMHGSGFKFGAISVGHRLEMWIGEMAVSTSGIKTISVTSQHAGSMSADMVVSH